MEIAKEVSCRHEKLMLLRLFDGGASATSAEEHHILLMKKS